MSASDDRAIAIATYNRAQELYYSTRTSEQDHEMLQAALTSRHHWRLVGGEQEFAVSDWLMSRIYVAFNEPRLAVEFALSSISHDQKTFPHWLKASLKEGLARAYKSANKMHEFEHYKGLALAELALESDPDEVKIIAEQIAEI